MSSHRAPDAATSDPADSAPVPADPAPLITPDIHVALTHAPLSPAAVLAFLSSPDAGANVLFAGTTRATAAGRAVTHLSYSAYAPLALRTMQRVAREARAAHGLARVALVHRLGEVPVGESSVLVGVSSAHRAAAWRGAEEVLERCKAAVEVWKREEFEGGDGVWKANREGEGAAGGEGKGEEGRRGVEDGDGNGDGNGDGDEEAPVSGR